MAAAILEIQVDETVRQQAERISAVAGLTLQEVMQRILSRAVRENALPMDLFEPNAETIEAMEAGRRRDVEHLDGIEALRAQVFEEA
jgi:DNA-damage-inducible protein J